MLKLNFQKRKTEEDFGFQSGLDNPYKFLNQTKSGENKG